MGNLAGIAFVTAALIACTGDIGGGPQAECPDDDPSCVAQAQPDAGSGNGADAEDCPAVQLTVTPLLPTVQLVIDQSGSMGADFNGVTRWEAVKNALVDPVNGLVSRLQSRVIFGASLYSSIGGSAGGTCPLLEEASPRLDNQANIASLLAANQPRSDTPTAEALRAVKLAFPPVDPANPGPRIIVLATDGNPDNCADPNAHDLGSQQMSESEVQAAHAAGIETYVLSVGDQVAVPHLQKMANAGVGESMATGTAPYYVANDPTQLVDAFNQIIKGARVCTFTVDGRVDPAAASGGTVTLNGTPLQHGTDWRMNDETTLELLGGACDTFLNEDNVTLNAGFPCGAVVL